MDFSLNHPDVGSSFFDLVRQQEPSLFPRFPLEKPEVKGAVPPLPVGTTVLAIRYRGGVVIAGDRQATEGYFRPRGARRSRRWRPRSPKRA